MARTVFAGDEVFHIWAHQAAPTGRRGDGRVYFHGRILYSYGSHFALGIIMPDRVALLNSDGYSVSTGKHKSQTLRAVPGRYFYVPNLTEAAHTIAGIGDDVASGRKRDDGLASRLRRFVVARALALSDEAAIYLLNLIGAARSWPKIKREAQAEAAAAAARKAKRDAAENLAAAKKWAAVSPGMLQLEIAAALGRWHPKARDDFESIKLENLAKELHRAARALKAFPRFKALVWAHYQAVRARMSHIDKTAEKRRMRLAFRQNRMTFDGEDLRTASDWERGAAAGQRLLDFMGTYRGGRFLSEAKRALIAGNVAKMREKAADMRRQEERERFEKAAADRATWLAGGRPAGYVRLSDDRGGALLRVNGSDLETSHGARVPLDHAIRAFRFVKLCRESGKGWNRNGRTLRVGHYTVDRIEPSGDFVAGCHRIHWQECERIARAIGAFEAAPSDEALTRSVEHA